MSWQQPGHGLSGGAFDEIMSKGAALIQSVGRRIDAYVRGGASKLPRLEQAWCDAAYWFHEGLAETLDSIAVTKLETSIEVLLGAESSRRSESRLCEVLHAFYGLNEQDPIASDPSITVKQYVKGIVGPRSRFLHGVLSTLGVNAETARSNVELLSMVLLHECSLALDRFHLSQSPSDTISAFLTWVDDQRGAGTLRN